MSILHAVKIIPLLFELTLCTATCVQLPGAAPQSITYWPGESKLNLSFISISLNALRHLWRKSNS